MASRTENVKRNMMWSLINTVINIALPFVNKTVMIYVLGAQYTGLNSLFASILSMLSLAELGFGAAVVFSMYKPVAEGDDKMVCALLNLYRKIYRIIGLAILTFGLVLMPFLPYLIKDDLPNDINIYVLYVPYLASTVLGYLMFSYRGALFSATQRNDISTKIGMGMNFLSNGLQLVALLGFRSFYAYAYLAIPMTVCSNLVCYYVSKKYYPQYFCEGRVPREEIDGIKDRVAGVFIHKICATFRNTADSIIISAFLGLTELAKYQYYYYIIVMLLGFMSVITGNLIASVGNSISLESKEKNYNDFKRFFFLYEWITIWWTACLASLYQHFIKIWLGEEMLMSYAAVLVFCAYFFVAKTGDMVYVYREAAGLWSKDKYRPIIETVANIVLSIVLVNTFGVAGVLLATVLCLVFINYGWGAQILFKYYFEKSPMEYFAITLKNVIVLIVTCVVTYCVCGVCGDNGIVSFIMKLVICVVIPNLAIAVMTFRRSEFKSAIVFVKAILPRVRKSK